MIENRPLPQLAITAHAYAFAEYERACQAISSQAVAVLGFTEGDNWTINFGTGRMAREVPDAPATNEPAP